MNNPTRNTQWPEQLKRQLRAMGEFEEDDQSDMYFSSDSIDIRVEGDKTIFVDALTFPERGDGKWRPDFVFYYPTGRREPMKGDAKALVGFVTYLISRGNNETRKIQIGQARRHAKSQRNWERKMDQRTRNQAQGG